MDLATRLRHQLSMSQAQPVPFSSDLREDPVSPGVAAAVLIAVTDRAEPGVILTRRPDTMRRHAGQVAFPGGRTDPGDVDAVATALREAHEEIGLSPSDVSIVGPLDAYRTITGFHITPVLSVIPADLMLRADAEEVETIFEVPLSFLMQPENWSERAVMAEGRTRHFLEGFWGGQRIWGATAAMIANLGARLA